MYFVNRRREQWRRMQSRWARVGWSRTLVVPLALVAWAVLAAGGQPSASASAPGAPDVAVTSVVAAPADLAAGGGTVTVTGTVEHASSCRLELLSRQSFPVVYSRNPKACSTGPYSARVTIGPNPTAVPRTVAFALVAGNGASTSIDRFYVLLAGAPSVVVSSVDPSPADLAPGGGTVAVAGTVEHASSCQLELLSRQSFPVVYSHNPKACSTGPYSARVTIGPNPTAVPRTVAFALVARNQVSVSSGRLYVVLAGAHQTTTSPAPPPSMRPASTTTPPTTAMPSTTTAPPTTTVPTTTAPSVSLASDESSNWSGYVAGGGPYRVVKGTFTVPGPAAGEPGDGQVSEWVGVDGASDSDTALIQAGVAESGDPQSPGGVSIQPWWEILPASETDISTVSVSAGDRVTVTIWQLSGSTWEINLTDDTNGQSYTTPPEQFTGTGSSAEWIVEAPAQCQSQNQCQLTPLVPYSPDVVFSNLGMSGPETSLDQLTMVQAGQDVSTPSALSSGQFSVSYTGPQQPDQFFMPLASPSTAARARLARLLVWGHGGAPPGHVGPTP